MDLPEREKMQLAFAGNARVMVSTDAGGEGLNLQFCHVVVNYDIPWNPMRVEQRIGRVDRIGQESPVRALNFLIEDTVEYRVREVLEDKLAVILREFGVDKTGDILDSAQAGQLFDQLYAQAIRDPGSIETAVGTIVESLRTEGTAMKEATSALQSVEPLDPADVRRILSHPLPYWIERMTVSYLRARAGGARRSGPAWEVQWPGEGQTERIVFTLKDLKRAPTARHITLDDVRVSDLARRTPQFFPGQTVASITLPSLPKDVQGWWSVWKISFQGSEWSETRIMPLFITDQGQSLAPTARFVWDELLGDPVPDVSQLSVEESTRVFDSQNWPPRSTVSIFTRSSCTHSLTICVANARRPPTPLRPGDESLNVSACQRCASID
jgi:hypothetical protein